MLNKILDYEKQAMNDKIHQGIVVGLAVEDYDQIKLKYAKIDASVKNDLTDSFDFTKDKYLLNPGVYPQKPVKKIYENIHRKLLQDLEEEGLSLHNILGPTKAPGQTYKVIDFRNSEPYTKGGETATQAQSIMTSALIYYDDDQHIHDQRMVQDMSEAPKKLLKRGGKKGKRAKGLKQQKTLRDPDEKFAQGGAITFQQQNDPESDLDDDEKYDSLSLRDSNGKKANM